jgi:signal transduction histidine kinase/ABC-type amino acid transport substrate-binding protein
MSTTAIIKTNSILRKFRFSVWSVAFVLLLIFCAKDVSVVYGADDTSKERNIRVGFFEFSGYHEIDKNGNRSGFGYDVLQELQPYTNWKYEYVGYEAGWSQMLNMLDSGEIDLLSSTIKTPWKLAHFDFSKHPLGMSSTIMTFKTGQTKYKRKDYKKWNGLRVGMLNNNSKNDIFHEFTKEKAFTYTPVYYDSVTRMEEALQKGEVDSIVTGSLRQLKNETVFEEMDIHPFFFVVKKGNRKLLAEMNDAMDRLLADKPDILKELFRKYYEVPTIRAYCPISTDEFTGQNLNMAQFIQEHLHRISQINNWDVIVDTTRPPVNEDFLRSMDVICGIIKSERYKKTLDYPLQSIGKFKITLLAREDNDAFLNHSPEGWPNTSPIKIGYAPCTLECTNKLQQFANQYLLKYQVVPYSSEQELLQALKDGETDLLLAAQPEKQPGIEVAAICGESDIYFAVPDGKTSVFKELNQAIEYYLIYEQPVLDELEAQYLELPLSEKERVRLSEQARLSDHKEKPRERIRVCLYEDKLHGYIGEYIGRLAEMYNWDVEYINTTYSQAYQSLMEKKVDIVPSLAYTKERSENCLYSDLDFEVIYYFLATPQKNKKMQLNQPSTWADARIAVLDGSRAANTLKEFFDQHNVSCSIQYYETLAEAEQSVQDGFNDAVFTCTPQGLKPLAVFPTELTYLCINKDKPKLKEQIDSGMSYLKRNEPNFTTELMDRHFPTSDFNILMLSKAEMDAVEKFKSHPIRVDISPEIPPVKQYDPEEKEGTGLVRKLLDEISKNTGLIFEYLPPTTSKEARSRILQGQSDIWIGFGGDTSPIGKTAVSKNNIYIPLVKVFHKTHKNINSKNDVAAVPVEDSVLCSYFSSGELKENVIFYPNREECYRAVQMGAASYTLDTLQSAQYMLWKDYRFSDLVFSQTLHNEYDDPLKFIYSIQLDATIRDVIDKALKSFTQDQIQNYLQAVTFTGVKKPLLTPMQLVILVAAMIACILLTAVIFFHRSNIVQKRQLAIQKSTSECLESLFLEEQDFNEAAKSIIEMLVKYFDAQLGWFARYDEKSISVDALVGFPKSFRSDCLSSVTGETLRAWIDSQENKEIQRVFYEKTPNIFTVKAWDDYLVERKIKTLFAAVIRVGGKIRGNIAVGFDTIRPELGPTETYMLNYFQHMVRASMVRRKLIEDLTLERDRAIQAEKSKSFFFACVSHDIRTPLNSIIGFAELLKCGDIEKKVSDEYLNNIVFSSHVLMELVNNILDLSKLDAKSMVYTYDFCDFKELGNKVLNAFTHRAHIENLQLKMECPDYMPLLKMDSQRVHQILFNLIGNAIKFTKQGSITLKVGCKPVENGSTRMNLEFSVRDTGIGIDKSHFKDIFKPFQQIQNMTQTGGTGLGLSICALMIEQMGGTIGVDSEVGKGSVFTVKLNNLDSMPLTAKEETILKTGEKAMVLPANLSLLLLDDVEMNLKVLEALCRKAGVQDIAMVHSAEDALEILKTRHFSAVLTDMWMPGMSGVDFAKYIRNEKKDTNLPIYLITADTEFLKHYKKEGFNGCLAKPITLAKIKEVLQSL